MNTVQGTTSQIAKGGNVSQINLRGLGAAQTLILVDGRRMPAFNATGDLRQPDINSTLLTSI